MGDLSDRLACALEGKPCATLVQIDRYVLPGAVWEKGSRPRPLCDTCPEHSKAEHEKRIRCVEVVRHYGDDERVPEGLLDTLRNDPRYRKVEQ
jgi:hypothetical protein